MENIFTTQPYATGEYWIFNNGQFGEKTPIMNQDHYSILRGDNGEIYGLNHWKSNNTGNSRFDSSLFNVNSLSGQKLEIYNTLLKISWTIENTYY